LFLVLTRFSLEIFFRCPYSLIRDAFRKFLVKTIYCAIIM